MQYVRQAGSDPSFLLKALSEASGELRRALYGVPRSGLMEPAPAPDDGWSLMAIAVHLRDVEAGVGEQLRTMLSGREPDIRHVDIDDIPLPEDCRIEDEDDVLDAFHYFRRRNAYTLWDLDPREWQRTGMHPYRGALSVMDIARELYQHDLEHLWQARRILDALSGIYR